ncbi:hypothetical protein BBP40_005171 [Aspergillus hancockii]|nr:hypothetical protein BBP40_005171 [Aspergillus hancockii]
MATKSTSPERPPQFAAIIAGNIDGRTNNVRYRQRQFHRLHACILNRISEFKEAIAQDSGHTSEEVQAEVCLALKEIRSHYASLNFEQSVQVEYRVARGQDNLTRRKGAGIVYIIPTTHTIFYSVVAALSAALAGGNCVILELPKTTSRVTALLRSVLSTALDADSFTISETRPSEGFLSSVHVLEQEASDGKGTKIGLQSPNPLRTIAIVDRTANLQDAAIDLVTARFAFNGHSPYAPDMVLVNQFCMQPFVELLVKHAAKHLGTKERGPIPIPKRSKEPSMLDKIASEEGANVIVSGSGWAVVQVQNRNSTLLQAKFNERLLVLHAVSSLDDAINLCDATGIQGATYTFAALDAAKYVSESIDAQAAWINHVPYEMLLGPVIPLNCPLAPNTRYTTELFEVPRPQVVNRSANTVLARTLLEANTSKSDSGVNEFLSPLPTIDQRPGHKMGFFEQGIVTGGLITLTSLITVVSAAGYWVLRMQ